MAQKLSDYSFTKLRLYVPTFNNRALIELSSRILATIKKSGKKMNTKELTTLLRKHTIVTNELRIRIKHAKMGNKGDIYRLQKRIIEEHPEEALKEDQWRQR